MNNPNSPRANAVDRTASNNSSANNINDPSLVWDATTAERVTAERVTAERVTAERVTAATPESISGETPATHLEQVAPELRAAWLALAETLTAESQTLDPQPLIVAVQRRIQIRRRERQVRRIVALAAALFVTAGGVAGWNAVSRNANEPLVATTGEGSSKAVSGNTTENVPATDSRNTEIANNTPADNDTQVASDVATDLATNGSHSSVEDDGDSDWQDPVQQDADWQNFEPTADLAQDTTNTDAVATSDWDADEQSLAQFSLLVSNWESSQLATDPITAVIDSDLQTLESELQSDVF